MSVAPMTSPAHSAIVFTDRIHPESAVTETGLIDKQTTRAIQVLSALAGRLGRAAASLHSRIRKSLAIAPLAALSMVGLSGCSPPSTLERIQQEGVLHVVTRVSASVYYEEQDRQAGLEYELAKRFADHLDVELRLEVVDSIEEVHHRLDNRHTHLAAAGLTVDNFLETRYRIGPTYMTARPVVVYRSGSGRPRKPEDLLEKDILVMADSPQERRLERVREVYPELEWRARGDLDDADILHQVNEGIADVAVVNSNELLLNKVFFPKIHEAFSLASPQPVGWLFPQTRNDSLIHEARQFFRDLSKDGVLEQLEERYYGHLDRLDYVGAQTFVKHLEARLPRYEEMFRQAGEEHSLDWRLLAAIGYQESHWRPNAVSPTGVRGLMMLTQATAAFMDIENRVDPEQSIQGGSGYFARLLTRIPEHISEPDRTWFALAAYNVGFGHLQDARRITEDYGDNPDRWMHVKRHLPKLAQRHYYTQTRHGYARGWEPVVYVQNIRRYYDVLTWMYPEEGQDNLPLGEPDTTVNDSMEPIELPEEESSPPRRTPRPAIDVVPGAL